MTSEHVQRLAEWLEIKAPQVWAQFSAKATAQEALDASGATARIEEQNHYWKELVAKNERLREDATAEVRAEANQWTKEALELREQVKRLQAVNHEDHETNLVLLNSQVERADQAEKRVEELEKALDRAEDEGCVCGRLMNKEPHRPDCAFWPVNELRAALSQAQQSEPS